MWVGDGDWGVTQNTNMLVKSVQALGRLLYSTILSKCSQSCWLIGYKRPFSKSYTVTSMDDLYKIALLGHMSTFSSVRTPKKKLYSSSLTLPKHLTQLNMRQCLRSWRIWASMTNGYSGSNASSLMANLQSYLMGSQGENFSVNVGLDKVTPCHLWSLFLLLTSSKLLLIMLSDKVSYACPSTN